MQNKELIIEIDHLTNDGTGVGRVEKKPVYVANTIDKERILLRVDHEGKKAIYGTIKKILTPDGDRVIPRCNVYYQCGGCKLSFMNYKRQLLFKTNVVKKLYSKTDFDVIVHDTIGTEPYFYRNKVQTPVGIKNKKIVAGFYKENTHDIVPFDQCLVQDDISNEITQKVILAMKDNKIEPYNEDKRTGSIRHLLIRRSGSQSMLVLITSKDSFPGRNNFINSIRKYLPNVDTIIQNINTRHTNVILGDKERVLYGKGYIMDKLCGLDFKISPRSFYQINKKQTEVLYEHAIKCANLKKTDIVLDAYCGIGTIGLIAAKHVNKVIGVEIINDAINDAKINARLNNISNCEFFCDDATVFIDKLNLNIDVVFIDPPRKGCEEAFLKSLIKKKINRIIYISCNPETQVRDIKLLHEYGYSIKEVTPFDMFPQTVHVETVCLISRNEHLWKSGICPVRMSNFVIY